MPLRDITLEDIESLAVGAWILGTGGGGNPYLSLLNMRALYREGRPAQLIDAWNSDLYTIYSPVFSWLCRVPGLLPRWNPYQLAGMPYLSLSRWYARYSAVPIDPVNATARYPTREPTGGMSGPVCRYQNSTRLSGTQNA